MFYGEYRHSLDHKGRLILPARLRDISHEFGVEHFMITRGLEQCLFMFTQDEWRQQELKFKALPFTQKEARRFNRLFFSGASCITPDKQGRFVVPGYLKEYAGIERDVVIIGVSNRIEIWDQRRWDEFYQQASMDYETIAERVFDTRQEG